MPARSAKRASTPPISPRTCWRSSATSAPQAGPLNLNDVVIRAAPLFRRLLGPRVECMLRLTPGVGLIRADATQMEQVLLNLSLNARDAMPDGGILTIETAVTTLGAGEVAGCEAGSYVRLTVRDTGIGMDADTRARVFEPFFTTKGAGQGTGLGLAIVNGIVRQSSGAVAVESAPGQGTDVPRLPAAAGAAARRLGRAGSRRSPHRRPPGRNAVGLRPRSQRAAAGRPFARVPARYLAALGAPRRLTRAGGVTAERAHVFGHRRPSPRMIVRTRRWASASPCHRS